MRLMGKLLGEEEAADAFIDFADAQMARVTETIEDADPERPRVFIDRAGGYSEDCCMSFGPGNFGEYVEIAGGTNIAKDIIPNTFGTLNPEQIIAANPQHVVVTGGNWDAYVRWRLGRCGPRRDMTAARAKLEALTERTAMTGIEPSRTTTSTPSGTSSTTAPTISSPCNNWPSGSTPSSSPTSTPKRRWKNCTSASCRWTTRRGTGSR